MLIEEHCIAVNFDGWDLLYTCVVVRCRALLIHGRFEARTRVQGMQWGSMGLKTSQTFQQVGISVISETWDNSRVIKRVPVDPQNIYQDLTRCRTHQTIAWQLQIDTTFFGPQHHDIKSRVS